MVACMRVLGVDFGTSNTVAMVQYPDATGDGGPTRRTRPLLFDGSPLLPSAVYLDTDGRLLVGRDAERSSRRDPARFEPNPKRRIDDGAILLGEVEVPVPRVFAAVLTRVLAEARRQLGGPPEQVRLTHPERWGERRRAVLLEGARVAGLGTTQLVAEPVAAASYYTAVLGSALPVGRALAVYDLGGGTFDAAVVRRTATGFEVLAEGGIPDLGGLDFDHAVVQWLGRGYTDDPQWTRLERPADAADRRQRQLLYDDARGAKEMLSRTASADVHVPAVGTTAGVDAHLTRDELEALVRPYLEETVACLAQTVAQARLAPAHLVGIFLVGGSSRIPLAAHLIHTGLGVAPTTLEQPETVVVEGALSLGAPTAAAAVPPRRQVVQAPAASTAPAGAPRAVSPAPPAVPSPAAPAPVSPGQYPAAPVTPVPGPPIYGLPESGLPTPGPAEPPIYAPPASVPAAGYAPEPTVPPVLVVPVRPWYEEPVRLATAVVLALVVVAALILVALWIAGG